MTVSATAGSSLEEIAQEEMSRLNEASGLHSVLNFKLTDYIAAEPNGTIYFPESVVEDIQTKANTTQTKQVIRFLLAHEQAHQVQFRTYGVNAVRPGAYGVNAVKPSDGPSDRARQIGRIRECQADILGAKYLLENLNEIDQSDALSQRNVSETLHDVLDVAFSLGAKERGADHPGPNMRRTAARLGLSRGILEKIKQHLQDDPRFAGSQRQLEIVLDVRPAQDVMAWSLRCAKRIVHYDSAALHDLAIVDAQTSLPDAHASSGSATFNLDYTNTGESAISVDMEVQCVTASEEDPDDTFRWEKWSVRNFAFSLKPGQTYHATGRLQWDQGGNGKIARLIIPVQNDDALLSVVRTN